jgi:SAM-dependent methyltransferase
MRSTASAAAPYAHQGQDAVRATFELAWFAHRIPRLLRAAGGGELLDLGCGDGAAGRLAGQGLSRYLGVDLASREPAVVQHDLREGLGPIGTRPFDLYLATFGLASHLAPRELSRLLSEIAGHGRSGSLVAMEALGLWSLEWPHLWDSPPGRSRLLRYRLAGDVLVHPWSPLELFALFEQAGIRPLRAADRTLQAGPKTGGYWPGLPDLRRALNALICQATAATEALAEPLPPLPAGEAALIHHTLAARRRALWSGGVPSASDVWKLEPPTRGGFGHGLLVVGRVER